MNKLILITILLGSLSFSQTLINKNGYNIVPEKGDISIGTDASSMINFIGNIFSGNSDSFDVNFNEGSYIYIKHITSEKTAIRYNIGAYFNAETENFSFGVGYGREFRKGNTRLQGFYGFQGFVGMHYEEEFTTSLNPALFIGCEYFIIPKIAIGAEYSYGPTLSISEKIDFLLNGHTGSLRMNFYF